MFLLSALGETLSLPFPDPGGSRHLYSMAASLQSQPLSLHRCLLFSLCVCLLFPIKMGLSGFKAHLDNIGWSHLQILHYIHKGPFFKLGHIHRFQALGYRYINPLWFIWRIFSRTISLWVKMPRFSLKKMVLTKKLLKYFPILFIKYSYSYYALLI